MIIINRKQIKKILYDHPRNKLLTEGILIRIGVLEEAKAHPEDYDGIFPTGSGCSLLRDSPVEYDMISSFNREEQLEMLNKWIYEEKSKLNYIQRQIQTVEVALKSLTYEQQLVIELRFFERMSWADVEINFNANYKKCYKAERTLVNICDKALDNLADFLQ